MSIRERLLYVLQSWRSIVAPRWLPPPRPWWPLSRVAFYAILVFDGVLLVVLRDFDLIPGLLFIAYSAAGLGVVLSEPRLYSSTLDTATEARAG